MARVITTSPSLLNRTRALPSLANPLPMPKSSPEPLAHVQVPADHFPEIGPSSLAEWTLVPPIPERPNPRPHWRTPRVRREPFAIGWREEAQLRADSRRAPSPRSPRAEPVLTAFPTQGPRGRAPKEAPCSVLPRCVQPPPPRASPSAPTPRYSPPRRTSVQRGSGQDTFLASSSVGPPRKQMQTPVTTLFVQSSS